MVPCVGATVCGITYFPLYNNQAMFRIQDSYPDDVFEKIQENSEAGFALAFEIFHILCEEGEAVRRYYGYEPGGLPEWEDAEHGCYTPADTLTMKNAIFAAWTRGWGQEVNVDEEIDLILLELKKKNE